MSMKRPAKRASRRGLLLVEAVLSAVVIGVGLSFITRGMANQLKALRAVEEYDTLLGLSRSAMQELEARHVVPANRSGRFEPPYEGYGWSLTATPRDGPNELIGQNGQPLTSTVVLTVQRQDRPSSSLQLTAVWPVVWIRQ